MEKSKKLKESSTSYGYYSKVLNKPYDTLEELRQAEADYVKPMNTKEADTEEVKLAIKNRIESEEAATKAKEEAYNAYLDVCEAEDKKVEETRTVEAEKLEAFCTKYKEGFHESIEVGDTTYVIDHKYDVHDTDLSDYIPFIKFLID